MITILKVFFLLGFLIIIHETGHFVVARLCKIRVNEFAIGFGPILFSKNKGYTKYELRLIPLGGFVNLEGENPEDNKTEGNNKNAEAKDNLSTAFYKATITKRISVILAGGLVNIVFGIFIFFLLITIRYSIVYSANLGNSIVHGFNAIGELFNIIKEGIIQIFTGNISLNDMAGPVGISSMVSKTNGIVEFIYLLSIISISLGITNLLPIIPLDGGKALLLIIEGIRKKPLKASIEEKIQSIGFILLIAFSIIVTFNDVLKLIK